jgi:hypothetical protein
MKAGLTLFLVLFAVCSFGCGSIPKLEDPACEASRGVVKQLYSIHFGNDMALSAESLAPKKKFLTDSLFSTLAQATPGSDPLTTGDTDFAKAFRVGGCRVVNPDTTDVEVILFWKTDTRTEQRELHVDVIRTNGEWFVNGIRR